MTFIRGEKCELRVLNESPEEVKAWADSVNAGLTTRHLFTGSFPMRYIDIAATWKKERESGAVLFGIWVRGALVVHKHPDETSYMLPDRFIGTCGLHSPREIYRSWELRILIFDPDALGKGIGTEATTMLVNYAFSRLNAHRVWLGLNAENLPALNCYKKVGFVEEGRLRDEIFCYGKYVDAIRMSVLEGEWRSTKP